MDPETRRGRARIIKDITVRIHDSEAKCPPLAAMWMAILTGITTTQIGETGVLPPIVSMTSHGLAPSDISLSPFLWSNAPEWLGLDTELAMEMLQPEHKDADWRAKPDQDGYVSLRSIRKMLETYAETGELRWTSRKAKAGSWKAICEENGVEWAAWQSGPIQGGRQPGTERIAIVKFKAGREPGLAKHDIAQQFSEEAGCNVYLISPEQIPDRCRHSELSKAETIYGHPH